MLTKKDEKDESKKFSQGDFNEFRLAGKKMNKEDVEKM